MHEIISADDLTDVRYLKGVSGVYCLTFKSGKRYIGRSKDLAVRISQHVGTMMCGLHQSIPIQCELEKSGLKSIQVLEVCDLDILAEREIYHIKTNKNLLNEVVYSKSIIKMLDKAKTYTPVNFQGVIESICELDPQDVVYRDALVKYPFLEQAIAEIGFEGIKKMGYVQTNIKRKLVNSLDITNASKAAKLMKLQSAFEQFAFIAAKDAKYRIGKIYKELGIERTPNIKDYYEVKETKRRVSGKVTAGYTIIRPKIVLAA